MANKPTKRSSSRKEDRELETAYKKMTGSKKSGTKSDKTAKKSRKGPIIAVSICIVLLAAALVFGYLYLFSGVTPGRILDNVSVAGINVGGMTKAEAISTLESATGNSFSEKSMTVTLLDNSVELKPAVTGVKLDIEAAVEIAYSYGRTGDTNRRNQEKLKALSEGIRADITSCIHLNTNAVTAELDVLVNDSVSELVQSTYTVEGSRPELSYDPDAGSEPTGKQTLIITKGKRQCVITTQSLMDQVMNAYAQANFQLTAVCQTKEPDDVDLDGIYNEYCVKAVDAQIDSETFEIIPHSYGWQFDLENAKKLLEEAAYGEAVEIPFALIVPEVTYEGINKGLFGDELSSYTARAAYDADRNVNLSLACKAIDGIILQPGDIFDYNDALGERTPENGYRPGASYAGEDTVYTYGGGICQVSSALYCCVLLADLEVVTRVEHGFASSYVPLGMDATVSWGGPEFRFRNNTDNPIKIEAVAEGSNVIVKILGSDTKEYYVDVENEVLEVFDWETEYVEMTSDNEKGYKDGDVIVTPYTGYTVKTYRCRYDKETDELIEKVYEDRSTYSSRNRKVCKIVDLEPEVPETTTPIETTVPADAPEIGIPGSGDISGGIEEG